MAKVATMHPNSLAALLLLCHVFPWMIFSNDLPFLSASNFHLPF